jgi:hypothetical protein
MQKAIDAVVKDSADETEIPEDIEDQLRKRLGVEPQRTWDDLRWDAQNIPFELAEFSGMTWSTSQCSMILPFSSSRKMSIPA